jgi:hypothetical protein
VTGENNARSGNSLQGMLLVSLVFFYFLLFAQFGFLEGLGRQFETRQLQTLMGLMGIGGVAGSALAGFRCFPGSIRVRMAIGFIGCLGTALGSLSADTVPLNGLVSLAIGLFLGLLTVSLIGHLQGSFPRKRAGLYCGIGTGTAYALANLPFLHWLPPEGKALAAVAACAVGLALLIRIEPRRACIAEPATAERTSGFATLAVVVVAFLVLVWSDSAAFRLIQGDEALLSISWFGTAGLLSIACFHFLGGLGAGMLVDRGWLMSVLGAAYLGLWLGYGLILGSIVPPTGAWVYATGVSFYSTGLVAFPLISRIRLPVVVQAGWTFAVAGWIGSGMGIGMADDLSEFPPFAWLVGGALIATGFLFHRRIRKGAE